MSGQRDEKSGFAPLPQTSNPLVRDLRAWMPRFIRAIRACRLYPATSGMRHQHIEDAFAGLAELLARQKTITIGIRDGAFFTGEEEVFLDDDIRTGPTYFLAGHAIFELTFEDGLEARELETLIAILAEDPAHQRRLGEDLITLLWRFHMKRVRYRFVDVLAVAVRADGRTMRRAAIADDEETRRLRDELDRMVRVLAVDAATGEDITELVDRELDTAEACRIAASGDSRRFESAIAMAEARVSRRYLDAIRLDMQVTRSHDFLSERLADLLIEALSAEPDVAASRSSPGLAVLLRLFEGMLRDRLFEVAFGLIERVRDLARRPRDPVDVEVARMILSGIAGESTARAAILALDQVDDAQSTNQIMGLLSTLGDESIPFVLRSIDLIERDAPRKALASLAVSLTTRRRQDLYEAMRNARPEVAVDLLIACYPMAANERAELIAIGAGHPEPAVRAQAFRALLRYGPGKPDDLFFRALRDPDATVRGIAIRAVAGRRNPMAAKHLSQLIAREDFLERDLQEVRVLLAAFGYLGGGGAVLELEQLLAKTSSITGSHRGVPEAVALALSVIDSPAAKELLAKGARSLNPRLRSACKAAQMQGGPRELQGLGILSHETALGGDAWPDLAHLRSSLPSSYEVAPSGPPAREQPAASSRPSARSVNAIAGIPKPGAPREGRASRTGDLSSPAGLPEAHAAGPSFKRKSGVMFIPLSENANLAATSGGRARPLERDADAATYDTGDLGDAPPMLPDDALSPIEE